MWKSAGRSLEKRAEKVSDQHRAQDAIVLVASLSLSLSLPPFIGEGNNDAFSN